MRAKRNDEEYGNRTMPSGTEPEQGGEWGVCWRLEPRAPHLTVLRLRDNHGSIIGTGSRLEKMLRK